MKSLIRRIWTVLGTAFSIAVSFVPNIGKTQEKSIFDPAIYPRAHFQWCMKHYNTYRALDNTFITSDGQRAECISPFLKKNPDEKQKKSGR
ncbi:BA14K family protein [Ahrensia sp. 13_GOM-1096m]|uniref:BA14K family protein n=1 Tax=Ahrensia sp. 13_GOM-1096m TaxID=1380380 RepID=UPI00047BD246|nr:BA14K family protein [Ahrensia sp. 13_GOM-1096m]